MRYAIFKDKKYINGVGQNCTEGEEISKEEYDKIQNLLKNAPVALKGKMNKLSIDYKWVSVELPIESIEITDEEAFDIIYKGAE